MSDNRYTLDTNILIYSVDCDAGEKHEKAIGIIDKAIGDDCILTVQSLAEFYSAVTRKGYAKPAEALEFIQVWTKLFVVAAASGACLLKAIEGVQSYKLSFWDAMLWATAKEAGCRTILSEDFQDKQTVQGIQFINPF
jgi:predicted nucleic acid-binding protein